MKRLSDTAIKECVAELRAACRLPIDEEALDTVVGWMRPNFERILDHGDGIRRWGDHGHRVRDSARHLGAFADFFAGHGDSSVIGFEELKRAAAIIRADCTARGERSPMAWEYCTKAPLDLREAEAFLRVLAPVPEAV